MTVDPFFSGIAMKAASAAYPRIIRKIQAERWERARAIFLKRMARGSFRAGLEDRAAYSTWQYFRAAADGAAARNLELIAQAIRSDIEETTLIAEDMKRLMDTLASLSREEAVLLGTVARAQRRAAAGEIPADTIWAAVLTELQASSLFPSGEDVAAHGSALMRTGWLRSTSGYGALGIVPTPRFDAVTRMVDFDDPDVVCP